MSACALAIETATERCSVALLIDGVVHEEHLADHRDSSRQIYGVIRELLAGQERELKDLDWLAFGAGPGGFTGLRVACSVAQALGYGLGIPLVSVSTLASIAVPVLVGDPAHPVAVALDARMGEAYLGIYEADESGLPVARVADALVAPTAEGGAAAAGLKGAGPGWAAFSDWAEPLGVKPVDEDIWPTAGALLAIAQRDVAAGRTVEPAAALPNYLRNDVAQPGG